VKIYYVAQTGAPDFEELTRKGFITFYPTVDDYVFLEVTNRNEPLLRQEVRLDITFLRKDDMLVTVTDDELEPMRRSTVDQIMVGAQILVVRGYCEGLDGVVTEIKGQKCKVMLDGLYHEYAVEVALTDIVKREEQ
jgi:transcription antitermination factor NusG